MKTPEQEQQMQQLLRAFAESKPPFFKVPAKAADWTVRGTTLELGFLDKPCVGYAREAFEDERGRAALSAAFPEVQAVRTMHGFLGDDPAEFKRAPQPVREHLLAWVKANMRPARHFADYSSYWLKHVFERSTDGFSLSNGEFKGAMRAAGFEPEDDTEQNWLFRIKVGHLRRLPSRTGYRPRPGELEAQQV